ncbi:MAG TPA: hypothetical protein VIM58_00575 [Candidatus Methylacidiphilales bacterium]
MAAMGFFRRNARDLMVLAWFVGIVTSFIMCAPGNPVFFLGYGATLLLALPGLLLLRGFARIAAFAAAVFAILSLGISVRAALDPLGRPVDKANMMRAIAGAKQITLAAQDGGYPADLPVKTDKEYLEHLVQSGQIREADLPLVTFRLHGAQTIGELSGKTIDYIFYRVSKDDPPETIFMTLKPRYAPRLALAITKGGSGQAVPTSQFVPKLPPRQPEALDSVP